MKNHCLNSNKLRSGNRAALFTLAVALVALLPPAQAAKPPKPPPPTLDTGTIYYTAAGDTYGIWTMNPDGSAKTFLLAWSSHRFTEPSRARHNGSRWFLTVAKPDNSEDYELVAVREDASVVVQVAARPVGVTLYVGEFGDDPAYAEPRWANRTQTDGVIHDGRVSYKGLDTATGQLGFYAADIDPESLESALEAVPSSRIRSDIALSFSFRGGYEWSPDGEWIVYSVYDAATDGRRIAVADANGESAPATIAADAVQPRWSPVRPDGTSRIAFLTGGGGAMTWDSANPDGSDRKTIIPALSNPATSEPARNVFGANLRWSPHGTYLVYDVTQEKDVHTWSMQRFIYRATADGGSPTCLTKTLNSAFPLGWGAEL